MTLDFKKLLRNGILKQMSIQHVEIPEKNVQIFKREELAEHGTVCGKMKQTFGENILLGGDYWLFFSNAGTDLEFDKDFMTKTLFKVINNALGNSANDGKPEELRSFSFDEVQIPSEPPADIDDTDLTDTDAEDQNDDAVTDLLNPGRKTVAESVESPVTGEKFVFLPILMK